MAAMVTKTSPKEKLSSSLTTSSRLSRTLVSQNVAQMNALPTASPVPSGSLKRKPSRSPRVEMTRTPKKLTKIAASDTRPIGCLSNGTERMTTTTGQV